MSRRTRGGNITIRSGTSEKYWYTQAGYIAAAVIMVVYTVVTFDATEGNAMATALTLGVFMLILVFLGLGTYIALFKDNAYIRGQYHAWEPRWWYYIGAGLGIPLLAYFAVGAIGQDGDAAGVAMLIFIVSTLGMNTAWLYNRHRYIGIP